MLLDLFANSIWGGDVPTCSACIASHVPPTTALRYVDQLVEAGMVERFCDPGDGRRTLLRLSNETLASLGSYFMATLGHEPKP